MSSKGPYVPPGLLFTTLLPRLGNHTLRQKTYSNPWQAMFSAESYWNRHGNTLSRQGYRSPRFLDAFVAVDEKKRLRPGRNRASYLVRYRTDRGDREERFFRLGDAEAFHRGLFFRRRPRFSVFPNIYVYLT
jgi:hypothetical protein